ncbi:hypothetical protein V6Z12_D07G206800 [Gossypium hirsutum]
MFKIYYGLKFSQARAISDFKFVGLRSSRTGFEGFKYF